MMVSADECTKSQEWTTEWRRLVANLGRPEGLARLTRQKLQLTIPWTPKHSISSDLGRLLDVMWLGLTDVAVAAARRGGAGHGADRSVRHVVLKALPQQPDVSALAKSE